MREILEFSIDQLKPRKPEVFQGLGMGSGDTPTPRTEELFDQAIETFLNTAAPSGIVAGITISQFAKIYNGNGNNENPSPLEDIFPRADAVALFAFTLGKEISYQIGKLFHQKEYAHGAMLDAVASCSAERAAAHAEKWYKDYLQRKKKKWGSKTVLLYSPGYCGWHVSGQEKLFKRLKPEEIGISLNTSFLMIPLKSVSGALVAGDADIHMFENTFKFCSLCFDKSCKKRMKHIKNSNMED